MLWKTTQVIPRVRKQSSEIFVFLSPNIHQVTKKGWVDLGRGKMAGLGLGLGWAWVGRHYCGPELQSRQVIGGDDVQVANDDMRAHV